MICLRSLRRSINQGWEGRGGPACGHGKKDHRDDVAERNENIGHRGGMGPRATIYGIKIGRNHILFSIPSNTLIYPVAAPALTRPGPPT